VSVSYAFARYFRGFETIKIDLNKNYFLVGENSSGKSSILYFLECIFQTELMADIRLNTVHSVDKYDFFSPYFKYRDVDLGLFVENESTLATRIITVSREKRLDDPFVKRASFFANGFGISVWKKGNSIFTRYFHIQRGMTQQEILSEHHQNKGFTKINNSNVESINQWDVFYDASDKLEGKNKRLVDLFSPLLGNCRHIGPVRGNPEIYYRFDRKITNTGTHFASILIDLIDTESREAYNIINKFGSQSKLFDKIHIRKLIRDKPAAPLYVEIEKNGKRFDLTQVGAGVSQIAPIVAEIFANITGLFDNTLFLIQQPELHLHPRAQAAFGEFINNAAIFGTRFVIETHSDFLIDRYRSRMPGFVKAVENLNHDSIISQKNSDYNQNPEKIMKMVETIKAQKNPLNVSILFCQNTPSGNQVKEIMINKSGEMDNIPEEYNSFFIDELARNLA